MTLRDEPGGARELHRSRVYDGPVFALDDVSLEFEGQQLRRQWLVHPGSVAVLAIDESDRAIVLQQYRAPLDARCWELPAGLLDMEGESALDAARRELLEEAETAAETWSTLVDAAPSGGSTDELFRVFLAEGLSAAESDFERTGEEAHMRVTRVPFEDLLEAVLDLRVRNAALQLGVLALDARRRRGIPPASAEAQGPR